MEHPIYQGSSKDPVLPIFIMYYNMYFRGIVIVWVKKVLQEKLATFTKTLHYNNFSCIIFCVIVSFFETVLSGSIETGWDQKIIQVKSTITFTLTETKLYLVPTLYFNFVYIHFQFSYLFKILTELTME